MKQTVKVALLIGDIYDRDELPEPFNQLAEILRYDDADNVTVRMDPSNEMEVIVTGISTTSFDDQFRQLSRKLENEHRGRDPKTVYHQIVRIIVHERVDSPLTVLRHLAPHILVIGQTVLFEEIAHTVATSKSGLFSPLMLRFSSFYGKPSVHSGYSADEVGYDLDLPKNMGRLKQVLSFQPFLEAVLVKDENTLKAAIDSLNKADEFAQKPVLWVTAPELE